jgi:D-serine deaminase-like pyridoxal phosphate-dependent protein
VGQVTNLRVRESDPGLRADLEAVPPAPQPLSYAAVRQLLRGRSLPCALLDLDLLEWNARDMLRRAAGRPIRLGTKSIRSVEVLRFTMALSERFTGLLCYTAREAAWLAGLGFDDLVVAYPTVDRADIDAALDAAGGGTRIALMVDDPAQLAALGAAAAARGTILPVSIDLDMSTRFRFLYFGVMRSPVRDAAAAVTLAREIARYPYLRLDGLMGYESQVAGLPDDAPGARVKNAIVRGLKSRSLRDIAPRRRLATEALKEAGFSLRFVNGGGTGSLESTACDVAVTDIAAGSGLYGPALFDGFRAFSPAPALTFALPIVRRPQPGTFTCLGGGYVASGSAGPNRLPQPYLPAGARLLGAEGAGEVQTPITYRGAETLKIGDPIVFRHAKAGELGERFERMLVIRGGHVTGEYTTYRGDGKCFV